MAILWKEEIDQAKETIRFDPLPWFVLDAILTLTLGLILICHLLYGR